jgi:hypothetical protein
MLVAEIYPSSSYILNRGWIDRSARHIPTYGEITGSSKNEKAKGQDDGSASESLPEDQDANGDELDDDDFDEIVDRFESSYNFRFEEPCVPWLLLVLSLYSYLIAMQRCRRN